MCNDPSKETTHNTIKKIALFDIFDSDTINLHFFSSKNDVISETHSLGPIFSFNTKALLFAKCISSLKDMTDTGTNIKREREQMNVYS